MNKGLCLGLLLWTATAQAFIHAQIGSTITNVDLPTLHGTNSALLTRAEVNVFLFFKPSQQHSRAVLVALAACERETEGKSVHWVAVASDRAARSDLEADVKAAGLRMPVLIDRGDELYGRLGVALTPVIGITDKEFRLVAYEPFRKVNYGIVLRARIRRLLNEITEEELARVLQPDALEDNTAAEAGRRWLKLAERFFAMTNYDRALGDVLKSLAKDSNLVAAHVLHGRILAAQGRDGEAAAALDRALQLDPTNAAALSTKQSLLTPGSQP